METVRVIHIFHALKVTQIQEIRSDIVLSARELKQDNAPHPNNLTHTPPNNTNFSSILTTAYMEILAILTNQILII
jgi:hypothetical protein